MGKGILWVVGIAAIVILAGVFGAYANQFSEHAIGGPAEWGMFGDFVGGLANPLLGFLTIFLLIVSLYYQTQELAATREELAQSKDAMQQANQLHDNNLQLQTRNNLRLQLEPHFHEAISAFHDTTRTEFRIDNKGMSLDVSLLKILAVLEGKDGLYPSHKNVSIRKEAEEWNDLFSGMAQLHRDLYLKAAEALVALIEYSDSELRVDFAKYHFTGAKAIMKDSRIYSEIDLAAIDEQIEQAINSREHLPFPTYHKKTKVY